MRNFSFFFFFEKGNIKIKLKREEETKGYKVRPETPRRATKLYKNCTQNPPPNKAQDYIMTANRSKDLPTTSFGSDREAYRS